MPRGVYQRKSADAAEVAVKKAPSKAKSPAKKPSKPLTQAALVLTQTPKAVMPLAPPISPVVITPPAAVAPIDTGTIRGSVDDMSGDKLKRYAKQVGVQQRDIDGLTEDRLRQNCKAMIYAAMED